MVHALFGVKAANIFKLFKLLFAVQDPTVDVPSRNQAPNQKVDHFFSQLIQVSTETFEPGLNISSDKKYASLQVHNEDKRRLTFKHKGYGFLIYAVCEDGYTAKFYPRNNPLPKKCIDKGY